MRRNKERGSESVEFALTVPIFFLIILGIAGLFVGGMKANALQKVANECLKQAIVDDTKTESALQIYAQAQLNNVYGVGGQIGVVLSKADPVVTVTVTAIYSMPWMGGEIRYLTLTGKASGNQFKRQDIVPPPKTP